MKTYNHMLDIGFVIKDSPHEDWMNVPLEVIIAALQKRVNYLKNTPNEFFEAVGHCDTYEE